MRARRPEWRCRGRGARSYAEVPPHSPRGSGVAIAARAPSEERPAARGGARHAELLHRPPGVVGARRRGGRCPGRLGHLDRAETSPQERPPAQPSRARSDATAAVGPPLSGPRSARAAPHRVPAGPPLPRATEPAALSEGQRGRGGAAAGRERSRGRRPPPPSMEWSYLLEIASLLAALSLLQRAGCAAASAAAASSSSSAKELSCQEITVPLCKGIGYNYTYMPNQFNHDTQDEAGLEVHQFWPLVEIQCSSDLRFFLCSMYTPICLEDYKKPLPPCRSVCERAKAGCAPLMRQYGFAWPDRMRCDRLPEQGSPDTLCMDYNRTDLTTAAPPPAKPPPRGAKPGGPARAPPAAPPPAEPPRKPPPPCEPGCQCRAPMVSVSSERHPLYNRVKTGQIANCALPCHNPYFSPDERAFTAFWIGLWSVLCFLSTFATVSTFLIDMERFKYPERPIIFLAACYLFVSLGYLVRLVAGHEKVACSGGAAAGGAGPGAAGGGRPARGAAAGGRGAAGGAAELQPELAVAEHVRYESTGPALCTVVFLLVYFFGMASSIWWVILSLTWFLAAGMKWGNEAIAGYAQYFHLAAWLLPSVKSIAVLALSSVDGDPVAGICYVGNQSLENLRGFVLAPLLIYLAIGSMFLLAGFVSLFRIRSVIKQQGGPTKTHKLEKLMIRLGLFTVLYTVPAASVVACLFYEQHNRPRWEATHNCPCLRDQQPDQARRPDYAVFMLKYFMCLVVGITSGVWVWSGKTLESWRALCTRCCWASKGAAVAGGAGTGAGGQAAITAAGGLGAGGGGSLYSDVSTGLTWRSGTASSVSYPKQMPLSQV
ncbi:LOW QUALITY PROTEIN: frizzled-8 [Cuculus canorus]|uniref:LOW QUALITY PROTEIN: frizzled-8 n=1 Tax=Cuculus canorus TaxID=55661 RepID=UPI0023AB4B42|nr:LOW QUALITY PROTEIN: frizzled-8 [Cuculus canorus]